MGSCLWECTWLRKKFSCHYFNTLRPRQDGRHFADDIFKCIFLNENVWIPIKISLKFVPKGPINNIPAMVQIMAWRRPGDKPLSEPMVVSLPMHICVTRPQWVKTLRLGDTYMCQWVGVITDSVNGLSPNWSLVIADLLSINSLAPNLLLLIGVFKSFCDNAISWMPSDLTDDKSALAQVMAWCRQAASHYLSLCWPISLLPYGISRTQWV